MKNKNLYVGIAFLVAFILWTLAVSFVGVEPIGPNGSEVGFAAMNLFFHELTGVNFALYFITDWLSLIPIAIAAGFGILGFIQLIKRRSFFKVDKNILILGGFYIAVLAFFVFFELSIINYRPVLIDGVLEASYPSSTTMLVSCIMLTANKELDLRIKNESLKILIKISMIAFTVFMVAARLVSGVHWLSDIIGGLLLSMGLVCLYYHLINK